MRYLPLIPLVFQLLAFSASANQEKAQFFLNHPWKRASDSSGLQPGVNLANQPMTQAISFQSQASKNIHARIDVLKRDLQAALRDETLTRERYIFSGRTPTRAHGRFYEKVVDQVEAIFREITDNARTRQITWEEGLGLVFKTEDIVSQDWRLKGEVPLINPLYLQYLRFKEYPVLVEALELWEQKMLDSPHSPPRQIASGKIIDTIQYLNRFLDSRQEIVNQSLSSEGAAACKRVVYALTKTIIGDVIYSIGLEIANDEIGLELGMFLRDQLMQVVNKKRPLGVSRTVGNTKIKGQSAVVSVGTGDLLDVPHPYGVRLAHEGICRGILSRSF